MLVVMTTLIFVSFRIFSRFAAKFSAIKRIVIHTTDWDVGPWELARFDVAPNHISNTGCLLPGSRILTEVGYQDIEKLKPGDTVIGPTTHESVEVTHNHLRDIDEYIYKLSFALENTGSVSATYEHPFLVWRSPICDAPQKKDYCTTYSCRTRKYHKSRLTRSPVCAGDNLTAFDIKEALEWIPASKLKVGDFSALYLGSHSKTTGLNRDLLYVCGWYLAEGWTDTRSDSVSLAFNALTEFHYLEEVAAIVNAYGYPTRYRIRGSVAELTISGKFYKKVIDKVIFGLRSHTKFLSSEFMESSIEDQSALLKGYILGDGNERDDSVRISTVSEYLAHQMFILFARQGHIPSKLKGRPEREATILGRVVSCQQEYIVSYRKDSRYSLGFIADDYLLFPIKEIEKVHYQGPVCNLTVDKEEAYIVNSISTHNCPGITYHELIMPDGGVYKTLPYVEVSWHVGAWNPGSVAIAMSYKVSNEDGKDTYGPTREALKSTIIRAGELCLKFKLNPKQVVGHRELKGTGWFFKKGSRRLRKTCPGLQVNLDHLRRKVAVYMQLKLREKDLYWGKIDGIFGARSMKALNRWEDVP